MVLNLNAPHLFITASAADLQWFDLQAQMPGFERYSEQTEHEQYRAASYNLTHNPHIATEWMLTKGAAVFTSLRCSEQLPQSPVNRTLNTTNTWLLGMTQ